MSLKEKQKLYLAVLKDEKLSEADNKVLLEFGGFTGWHSPGNSVSKTREGFATANRLNSRALLITYQSKQLQLKLEGLAGLNDIHLVKKVMEVPEVIQLVKDLPKAIEIMCKRNKADKFSWSLEICLKTYMNEYTESKLIRLHFHCCLQRDVSPFRCTTVSSTLAVGGIHPSHVVGCSDPVSGRKSKGTLAMHYYNQMPKKGKLCGGTNYKAYEDFLVNPRWIAGYVQRNKMHNEDAKQEPVFCLNPSTGGL